MWTARKLYQSPTILSGAEGGAPNAGLVLAGDTLYGVATGGGTAGLGTVFKLTTNGTGLVVLHEFSGHLFQRPTHQ